MTIVEQYESGMSISKISQARGVCASKIHRWLRASGVTMRPSGAAPVPKGLRDPCKAARVVELRRQGWTYAMIRDEACASLSYVKLRLREAGLTNGGRR